MLFRVLSRIFSLACDTGVESLKVAMRVACRVAYKSNGFRKELSIDSCNIVTLAPLLIGQKDAHRLHLPVLHDFYFGHRCSLLLLPF